MTWILALLGLAIVVGLGVWWLERPLWYKSDGVRALENFLRDLVSPRSPWPLMYVKARGRQTLEFSRERVDDGSFRLYAEVSLEGANSDLADALTKELEASHFSADQLTVTSETQISRIRVDLGRADGAALAEATQAARVMLERLGVQQDEPLHVRYAGTMDVDVVTPGLEDLKRRGGPFGRLLAKAGLKNLRRD